MRNSFLIVQWHDAFSNLSKFFWGLNCNWVYTKTSKKTMDCNPWTSLWSHPKSRVPQSFENHDDLMHVVLNMAFAWTVPWPFNLVCEGHFAHKSSPMNMKLWEPKRKSPKAVPTHLQTHVVWSWVLKCSVKSDVTGPSPKCFYNDLFYSYGSLLMIK